MEIKGQKNVVKSVKKILDIFLTSEGNIRPHFFLTGPSGSGKTFLIESLSNMMDIPFLEINAAQLTKEGTSGSSVSKALSPLKERTNKPMICFVDEFDKLFISGNNNSELAHEATNGVQNEFLRILESGNTSVFGDYGKYINVPTGNILFVFAGAFNGEDDIDLDRLRELGLKTEFLGRVGLIYNTERLNLDTLFNIFDNSNLFDTYCELFENVDKEKASYVIKNKIKEHYENNTLGARIINTLIHQYFINGGFKKEEDKKVTFQNKLTL